MNTPSGKNLYLEGGRAGHLCLPVNCLRAVELHNYYQETGELGLGRRGSIGPWRRIWIISRSSAAFRSLSGATGRLSLSRGEIGLLATGWNS